MEFQNLFSLLIYPPHKRRPRMTTSSSTCSSSRSECGGPGPTTMLSFLHLISLSLSVSFFRLFFIPFPVLYANEFNRYNLSLSKNFSRPRQEAERLIASFNLFPIKDVNIGRHHVDDLADSGITSRKFSFPYSCHETHRFDPSAESHGDYAGFYQVPRTEGARLFYYFFTSTSTEESPVVLWLTGGPGCSGSLAVFYENGPYHLSDGQCSLTQNKHSWTTLANVIYLDQPIGTGYSTITDNKYLRQGEDDVANDLDGFLQAFFKSYEKYAKKKFIVAGESYGGHYVPALVFLLNKRNKENLGGNRIRIPLEGMAIGNGLTHPIIQYRAYPKFALDNGLINSIDYQRITTLMFPTCSSLEHACDTGDDIACLEAFNECNRMFEFILNAANNTNYYDIRKKCDGPQCYDFSPMVKYLNRPKVIDVLRVGKTEFVSCSRAVYQAMEGDWMKNHADKILALLEDNINVLIYAGVKDLICNWLGNFWWVQAMVLEYQKRFQSDKFEPFLAEKFVPFLVGEEIKGELIRQGALIFLKMFEAGHMVPLDQPEASSNMLCRWMEGSLGIELDEHSRCVDSM